MSQNSLYYEKIIPVTLERLDEASVRGFQEVRMNHPGGAWRKDPQADFLSHLWAGSCFGQIYNHAEILAAENTQLRKDLARAQELQKNS